MIRKFIFLILLLPLTAIAQTKFGYFNYNELLHQHPQYAVVQAEYDSLVRRCENEVLRNEQELTRSYVAFLNGQQSFPEPILRKRQKELQELVDNSVIFRNELKVWLVEARDSLFAPLHATVDDVVARICLQNNLAYAVDLESVGYKFINPSFAYDITEVAIQLMNGVEVPVRLGTNSTEEQPITGDSNVATDIIVNAITEKMVATDSMKSSTIVECDEDTEKATVSPTE